MRITNNVTGTYTRGLECLKVSELLMAEAAAKLARAESMEALELWSEALAFQQEGFELLDTANLQRQPDAPTDDAVRAGQDNAVQVMAAQSGRTN
ncbi:MAG TPA: hypothetical protein VF525_03450 [Pyrinomonadaceae bacterium]|jgi:hypothetical protein